MRSFLYCNKLQQKRAALSATMICLGYSSSSGIFWKTQFTLPMLKSTDTSENRLIHVFAVKLFYLLLYFLYLTPTGQLFCGSLYPYDI